MAEYISFINTLPENPVIKAAIAQFVFEKIHPFPDGNGRVGRLISSLIINKSDYNFRSLAPIEDFINTHREDYYYNLEPTNICTGFIEFFLKSLIEQAKKHLPVLSSTAQKNLPEDSLMPRRRELLDTIRDHPNCSIDFLYRRFLKINRKTIAYDLSQLQKKGFVKKIGTTRGALYISVYT
jgi:Fic family protein